MLDSSWDLCASDVNRLYYWRMHVWTSKVCPIVFDVYSTSRIAYVTITIISEDSANPCLFQQCASDVNDLAYVTGFVSQDESKIACFDNIKL